jgi:hypothetical protein
MQQPSIKSKNQVAQAKLALGTHCCALRHCVNDDYIREVLISCMVVSSCTLLSAHHEWWVHERQRQLSSNHQHR